jgi:Zn-dependent peptidase ImmA (M78 family)/DNA-binding XRE family transcriptional regulator
VARTPFAPITPEVLRWARDDAGVTVADLAARVGVDAGRVRAWELGEEQPSLAKLRQAAELLGRPVAFFFVAEPPVQGVQRPTDFRRTDGPISRQLVRQIRLAEERRDAYAELERDAVASSPWRMWRQDPPRDADDVRNRLGVAPDQVRRTRNEHEALKTWITAVESQGVLVFQMSRIAVTECRGFAIDDVDSVPVIVLNGADAPQARTFTLMHEFGHLLDHTGAMCVLEEDVGAERRCNRFAEEVLMPSEAVRLSVGNREAWAAVDAVARDFRVSPVVAAIRLNRLGYVSQKIVGEAIRKMRDAAERETDRNGGPAPEVLVRRNLGEPYINAVLDAMSRDAISVMDATHMIGAKIETIDKIERLLVGGGR